MEKESIISKTFQYSRKLAKDSFINFSSAKNSFNIQISINFRKPSKISASQTNHNFAYNLICKSATKNLYRNKENGNFLHSPINFFSFWKIIDPNSEEVPIHYSKKNNRATIKQSIKYPNKISKYHNTTSILTDCQIIKFNEFDRNKKKKKVITPRIRTCTRTLSYCGKIKGAE